MKRRDTGILGEKLASQFLEKSGYRILETNFRCPPGEIDVVAVHGDCLVFVEVRAKSGQDFGSPEESVTRAKKGKLRATAAYYLQTHDNLPQMWRIDFVAVQMDRRGKPVRVELFESAVGESDT